MSNPLMPLPRPLLALPLLCAISLGAQSPVVRGPVGAAANAAVAAAAARGFNGAIVMEHAGKVVLSAGYGVADPVTGAPFTTTTIAQIGSLTKQFTGAAVGMLIREGRVALDAPLGEYAPNVRAAAARTTIAQLLTHTSGARESCGPDFAPTARGALFSACAAYFDEASVGRFSYSNLGYSVLGAVAELRTGIRLDALLKARFFDPLGMHDTGYEFADAKRPRMAAGVTPQGRVAPISERLGALQGDAWNLYGNGGMQSTVEDMHRWYRALSGATPPFDPELRALLIQPRARRDSVIAYGMGWYIRTNAAGEVEQVSHTGGDGVFFAAFVWRPLERSFFYLVTNTQGMGADLASELLRTLRSAAGGG